MHPRPFGRISATNRRAATPGSRHRSSWCRRSQIWSLGRMAPGFAATAQARDASRAGLWYSDAASLPGGISLFRQVRFCPGETELKSSTSRVSCQCPWHPDLLRRWRRSVVHATRVAVVIPPGRRPPSWRESLLPSAGHLARPR